MEVNHTDHDNPSPLRDVDPDWNCLLFSRQKNSGGDYFTDNQFNDRKVYKTIDFNAFSILHKKICSIPKHTRNYSNCLSNINKIFCTEFVRDLDRSLS